MKIIELIANITFKLGVLERRAKRDSFFKIANKFLDGYANRNYELAKNGETRILDILQAEVFSTLFDIGANKGEWSMYAAKIFPAAEIYSFEIASDVFDVFQERVQSISTIHPQAVGLSNIDGDVQLYSHAESDGMTSMVTSSHLHEAHASKARVVTGDSFCKQKNIQHIDFLKIDVEGAENLVLEGFRQMLSAGNITVIQFEYGLVNVYAKFLLKDFYDLLGTQYHIGKLLPHGVDFQEYDVKQEDFRGANYIAVLRSQQDIIELLRC